LTTGLQPKVFAAKLHFQNVIFRASQFQVKKYQKIRSTILHSYML